MPPAWIHLFLDTPVERWAEAVEFWSAVTGTQVSPARGEDGQFVTLLPAEGDPWLKLQAVPAGPRIHLDLDTSDRAAAVATARQLGGAVAWTYHDVVVMRSPGGLLFCHTLRDASARPHLHRAGGVAADQVCLDIPARLWDAEVRFWQAITGRDLESSSRPEFAFLGDPDPAGPIRLLLQRLDDDAPEVSAHLDLAVTDRRGEVGRHLRLGAERVAEEGSWTVLRAPSGHVYCLTDRDPRTGRVARPGGHRGSAVTAR
ncbi:MAG: VOC family protein [Nocardioides sp.]|uniref:VOC family protein n=1 Tax=Nocardioides sp. TaxID=35761 RepID=UPI0039E68D81